MESHHFSLYPSNLLVRAGATWKLKFYPNVDSPSPSLKQQ